MDCFRVDFQMNPTVLLKQSFRSLNNLLLRQLGHPTKIFHFTVETTRKCDGHCIYCGIWKSKPKKQKLTAQKILDYLRPKHMFFYVKEIGVTGGEPFLQKSLVDVCQALKTVCPNSSIGLVTNGLHPDLALKKMLELKEVDPNIHVGVSIDGYFEEDVVHRGNKTHPNKAWLTACLLKQHGFHVGIGSVVTDVNVANAASFDQFCWNLGFSHSVMTANPSNHYYENVEDLTENKCVLSPKNFGLFQKALSSGKKTSFDFYFMKYLQTQKQVMPCFSGFSSFFLNTQNLVYPCVSRNTVLGDLENQSFTEVWNGKKTVETRKSIKRGECHCYTMCETSGWFMANLFPAYKKKLLEKLGVG